MIGHGQLVVVDYRLVLGPKKISCVSGSEGLDVQIFWFRSSSLLGFYFGFSEEKDCTSAWLVLRSGSHTLPATCSVLFSLPVGGFGFSRCVGSGKFWVLVAFSEAYLIFGFVL